MRKLVSDISVNSLIKHFKGHTVFVFDSLSDLKKWLYN